METRNISVTLDKAIEWYNSDNKTLKEISLQAFTENELQSEDFKKLKSWADISYCLSYNVDYCTEGLTKGQIALVKLNAIRQVLNRGHKMNFKKGAIWYPYTPAILSTSIYYKDSNETEIAKVRIGHDIFTLLGGNAYSGTYAGLGRFFYYGGVAYSGASVGFLGCATKEIAQHMGIYFGKEIFEAKYSDFIDFEWIDYGK